MHFVPHWCLSIQFLYAMIAVALFSLTACMCQVIASCLIRTKIFFIFFSFFFIGVWGMIHNTIAQWWAPFTPFFYHHRRLLYHALSFAFDIKGLFHAIHYRHTVLKMRSFYVQYKSKNAVEVRIKTMVDVMWDWDRTHFRCI